MSSTTLMIDLSPFFESFGVGAAAREPSPKKIVESSHFVNCAASLIVNGRTRTVTEIDDAPSEMAIASTARGSPPSHLAQRNVQNAIQSQYQQNMNIEC